MHRLSLQTYYRPKHYLAGVFIAENFDQAFDIAMGKG
jgi:hypothetical protein